MLTIQYSSLMQMQLHFGSDQRPTVAQLFQRSQLSIVFEPMIFFNYPFAYSFDVASSRFHAFDPSIVVLRAQFLHSASYDVTNDTTTHSATVCMRLSYEAPLRIKGSVHAITATFMSD